MTDKFCPSIHQSFGWVVKALDHITVTGCGIETHSKPIFFNIKIQVENANHLDTISINSIHQYVSNILMYRPNLSYSRPIVKLGLTKACPSTFTDHSSKESPTQQPLQLIGIGWERVRQFQQKWNQFYNIRILLTQVQLPQINSIAPLFCG